MATYQIPLTPLPQTFGISLAGTTYNLTLQWRDAALGGWFLDIADVSNAPILSGIPLVTGADLLAQYAYLAFGGSLYVQNPGGGDAVPSFTNLGTDAILIFVTP